MLTLRVFNRIQTICPWDFLRKRLLYNNDLCVLFYQSTAENIYIWYTSLLLLPLASAVELVISITTWCHTVFRLHDEIASYPSTECFSAPSTSAHNNHIHFTPFARDNWRVENELQAMTTCLNSIGYNNSNTSDMNPKRHTCTQKCQCFSQNWAFSWH